MPETGVGAVVGRDRDAGGAVAVGVVTEPPAGGVRSIVVFALSAPVLPALSVATARRARLPSASSGHETLYGAAVSMPSETQLPAAQPALACEQRKNSTWATSRQAWSR